jgi:methylenetetrahydrofolate dehydrogenase (NADP+)/methenyltetrahydrofolate cyclohydrolase
VAAELLKSAPIVEAMVANQRQRLQELGGETLWIALVTTLGNDARIKTYIDRKNQHAGTIGAVLQKISTVTEQEAYHQIRKLNEQDGTDGIVVQLPLRDKSWTEQLLNSVAPHKDIDGNSRMGREFYLPPTAKAEIDLAEYYLGGAIEDAIDPERIGLIGLGRLTNSHVLPNLVNRGMQPTIIDETTPEKLDRLGRDNDLVFAASGIGGLIKPHHLEGARAGMMIIDAGTASSQGVRSGDVDKAVYAMDGIRVSPHIGGVGPLSVACLYGNGIEAVRMRDGFSLAKS